MKENLKEQNLENKDFLEIGIGNGEVSLKAAKKGAKVTAVDINNEAVEYSKKRFNEEEIESDIFKSDLFSEINGNYDFIVFNPPYLKGKEGLGDENMWRGGKTGLETSFEFLETVSRYLREDGKAWIILSSKTNYQKLVRRFDLRQVDSKKLWFERLFLMEFK